MSEAPPTRSRPRPSRRAGRRSGIRTRPQLFGRVVRTSTWLHRVPTGWKLAAIAVIGLTALVFRNGVVNWSIFVVLVILGLSARLPLRRFLIPWAYAAVLVAIVLGLQYLFGTLVAGLVVAGTVFACVQAALLLTLTTTIGELLDAFAVIVSPLRRLGVDPEVIALTASLMVRAISHLSGLLAEADRAARARGLETSLKARVVPAILRSVKYAQDTGRALDARGIVD
ncbi:CbiQ family ECF transporter T component [Brevibacterium casei]|uniref:Cobalt permease-like transporter n=1 Tax=Brevibacterium casei S18 TaxID=1229781 RepID=K9B1K3_9MICO|nr:CbiQ family ECF transporter T component [Brevibacterium casei]EKU48692.1 cobalt permease-like transporter [Brevibacterium casei S18]